MGSIANLILKLGKLNIEVVAKKNIAATSNIIADLTKKQLRKGELSTGEILPNYSIASQKYFDKPDIPIQLFDTGKFHNSFKIDVGSELLTWVADDLHDLEKRYSSDIYGMTAKSKQSYAKDTLYPLIIKDVKEITGL